VRTGSLGWEQFGNPEEGERLPLKPPPSNGSKDVTVDTSVCVCVCVCVCVRV
jgi:hypothetical protein